MIGFCPYCEKETSLTPVETIEDIDVRGEIIPVKVKFYHCDECGGDFDDPKSEDDALEVAYKEYRRRMNMVQPEEIKSFRKKYGLTQKELSDILGIGVATLSRYENGALQDVAHDRILRLGMKPDNLREMIESSGHILNQETKRQILNTLDEESISGWKKTFLEQFESREPDIYCGNRRFDRKKIFQTIKFFCYPDGVLKTKLNKLLFYSDFLSFKYYDQSITGCQYVHLPLGPVPDQFEMIYWILENMDPSFREEEIWVYDFAGEKYISDTQPDLSVFSPAELKILAIVNEKFKHLAAKAIKEYSHKEVGYQKTQDRDLIPYSYAKALIEF